MTFPNQGMIEVEIHLDAENRTKLNLLKSCLMHDLLTGKVRVPENF